MFGKRQVNGFRQQNFRGMQPRDLRVEPVVKFIVVEMGDADLAGGDVQKSQPGGAFVQKKRNQVIVLLVLDQAGLDDRAGRDQTDDLAREDAFLGLFADLFANGDVITLFDQAGNVIVRGMVGNARHGDLLPFGDVAAGQDDIQFTRSDLGVFVESLVKVSQAEEQNGIRIVLFNIQVLLADGRCVF